MRQVYLFVLLLLASGCARFLADSRCSPRSDVVTPEDYDACVADPHYGQHPAIAKTMPPPPPRKSIEQICTEETKAHGGSYWECKRYYQQQAWQNAQNYNQAVQQEQAQQMRDAAMIQAVGDAFKPQPSVHCNSRVNVFGQTVTDCSGW